MKKYGLLFAIGLMALIINIDSTSSILVAWLNLPNDLFTHAMSAGIEASMLLSGVVTLVGAGIAGVLISKKCFINYTVFNKLVRVLLC